MAEERTCPIVPGNDTYEGKQGLAYFAGVSAQNTGAQHLCLHVLVIPPGGRAVPHLHESHESAIYSRVRPRSGGVVARTDPNEQESVLLLPHLEPPLPPR